MRKTITILTILTSIFCPDIFSQSNFGKPKDFTNFDVKINPDFFLLGTFSDYNGRFQYIDRKTQIDRYFPYEESLANYITNFIKQHYEVKVETKFAESRHSEIFSPQLANRMHNEYFDFNGNFINLKSDTEEMKYSFLLGTYYRYGEHLEGNIYKIQDANSQKNKEICQILKDLGCDKMVYKFLRGYIPSSYIFYFAATPRMIKYFNLVRKDKEQLQKSYYDKIFEGEKGKELQQRSNKERNKLIKSLQVIFG